MHLGRVAAREARAAAGRDAEALVQRTTQHADGLRRRSPHVPDAEPAVVARGDDGETPQIRRSARPEHRVRREQFSFRRIGENLAVCEVTGAAYSVRAGGGC